jgi:hypothetical protein
MAKDKSTSGRGMMSMPGTATKVRADRYRTSYAPGDYAKSRQPVVNSSMISLPGTAMKMLGQKFSTKYTPGSYATYRKGLAAKKPATVVSNVTSEKLSPTPTKSKAPATKAVSMRTGDTTGVTTGKTTGTVSRTPGMASKTKQSAYGRQMANAARNQPAGPMGGGGRGGSMGGGTGPSRSGGGGNLGGARGRISEPGGSKR